MVCRLGTTGYRRCRARRHRAARTCHGGCSQTHRSYEVLNILWTTPAHRNLLAIFDYILADNPTAAAQTLNKIDAAIRRLADHPGLGRPGRVRGTRELVIAGLSYVVPYRATSSEIVILRILHTARKWPELF
ncbi:MAG: type II toxin-antitoxin system RelE/ParE family toxin [Gammaproteobacteria bacterium]